MNGCSSCTLYDCFCLPQHSRIFSISEIFVYDMKIDMWSVVQFFRLIWIVCVPILNVSLKFDKNVTFFCHVRFFFQHLADIRRFIERNHLFVADSTKDCLLHIERILLNIPCWNFHCWAKWLKEKMLTLMWN